MYSRSVIIQCIVYDFVIIIVALIFVSKYLYHSFETLLLFCLCLFTGKIAYRLQKALFVLFYRNFQPPSLHRLFGPPPLIGFQLTFQTPSPCLFGIQEE